MTRPSSGDDVLREHLTHAFTVPVDGPGFETAIDRLVQAVKAAGWVPAGLPVREGLELLVGAGVLGVHREADGFGQDVYWIEGDS